MMRIIFSGKFAWLLLSLGVLAIAYGFRYFAITLQNKPARNAEAIVSRLSEELAENTGAIEQLKETLMQSQNPSFGDLLIDTKYPYYIFSNRIIIFWSRSDYTPVYRDISGDFLLGYVETERGKFIAQKETFVHELRKYEIVFMVPLVQEFSLVNEYLKNTYNEDLFTDVNFELTPAPMDETYEGIQIDDRKLFFIHFGTTYTNSGAFERNTLLLLLLIALISLLVFIRKTLTYFTKKEKPFQGLLILVSSLIAIRGTMLLTQFPFDFTSIDIFNPLHYGSTVINPSLGDLFLNLLSLLFIGLYVFNNFLKPGTFRNVLRQSRLNKVLISIAAFFFSFFWLGVHHQTMRTLNFDSQWSMDITQKFEFELLKFFGYGLFFISAIIYFLFSHVCFRLFNQINTKSNRAFLISLLGGLLLFAGFAATMKWDYEIVVIVNILFFFVIRAFRLHRYLGRLQYLTFIYFFSFGLPVAAIGYYANDQFNKSTVDYKMARLATQLKLERNFLTELQLGDIAQRIKDDSYVKSRISTPFASKKILEKKIVSEYLTNVDQFDVQVFVFNSKGEPFEEFGIDDNYRDIKSRNGGNETDTDGLYYLPPGDGQSTAQYLSFIEIEYRTQLIGYILLDLKQKRVVPNSVFPLLLDEGMYGQQLKNPDQFSYCVLANGQIQNTSGPFNYRRHLPDIIQGSSEILQNSISFAGFTHKAFYGENTRFVVISAKEPSLNRQIAGFSFLFLVFIFSILLILILIAVYQSIQQIKLNYAARIQLYLNIAFFTPLIIVSVTTISIIVQSFKASLESQYVEYAENLSALISDPLYELRRTNIDIVELSDQVNQMAKVADVDMSVFNTNGRLLASSLLQVYQNDILSRNVSPLAYIRILENQESACVLEEEVGFLGFKNAYVSVRSSETGAIIGMLSLPFFASQKDLEQRVFEVLSYIINIFTFLFVIFLGVSFFVSHGLTFPLSLITQKIKRTTLSSFNEPLSWNSDDEIGLMVEEYNRMLVNLEESKKALAKSEKESAWREMARQVAHEIKNPLTPMKLTLQHMQRIKANDGKDNESSLKQINSLLEQIETLNDIATSFSDFAKMPIPKMGVLDIRKLLLETIELYNKKELGKISTGIEEGKFVIKGDKKWLGRAFSNLIINGFQAVSDGKEAVLNIKLHSQEPAKVRIEIKDNGEGIPAHVGDKVFTPNFSTKFTGSGLGLAIAKKGVEHAGGKIWFTSTEGDGTVFYVELPLA
jgi:two-component system nitrogen regulation sensor histidine kinase NtrY